MTKKENTFEPICQKDLSGLPDDLLNELSVRESGKDRTIINSRIFDLIRKFGRLSVDHLLIQLYKEYGKVYKRKFIINKLYKMKLSGYLSKEHINGNMVYYINSQHPIPDNKT